MKNMIIILVMFLTGMYAGAQGVDSKQFHEYRGNLNNAYKRFATEKEGRVVFLGGSITHNAGWRDSVSAYLQRRFPETRFDFINAGIPSMGSTPGAFRFSRDVLKNGRVDLLFEEAAVNDDTNRRKTEEIIRGMEGIVRHALRANPACDIVFMYFVDPGKMKDYREGKTPEVISLHDQVARYYELPAINLAAEVTARIDAGEFDWENDFKDLHPSPFGQNIYYHSIKSFFEHVWPDENYGKQGLIQEQKSGLKEDYQIRELPEPLDPFCYEKGILVAPSPRRTIRGWNMVENWKPADGKGTRPNYVNVPMFEGTWPGKIIKFHFTGTAVGIAVAAGPDAGTIEYSIDNSPWQKKDLFTPWSKNLHLPWYYTLAGDVKPGKHTLQIRMAEDRNPESTGRVCRIRYFYVNKK